MTSSSSWISAVRYDLWGDEDQDFPFQPLFIFRLEEPAQNRNLVEPGDAPDLFVVRGLVDAADDDRVPVVDHDGGVDFIFVDGRVALDRSRVVGIVVGGLDLHGDLALGGDGRLHIELEHRLLELYRLGDDTA